jgi:hypothetical protein
MVAVAMMTVMTGCGKNVPVLPESVVLSLERMTLAVGEQKQLTYELNYPYTRSNDIVIKRESDNTNVATVGIDNEICTGLNLSLRARAGQ